MVLAVPIPESKAYHEAGHATILWYYGIALQSVSIVPDLARGLWGATVPMPRPPITGRVELENEMRIAAAGDAAENHALGRQVPKADDLIKNLGLAERDVIENPDPEGHPQGHRDVRTFARMGRARDDAIRETDPQGGTGTASWVSVWLEAEQLIRSQLWRAVQAVAIELFTRPSHCLSGNEATALMSAALEGTD